MKLEFLVALLMIFTAHGEENISTTSAPSTLSASSTIASSSTVFVPITTELPTTPNVENSTKPASLPSNRTQHFNTTSYTCNCDLTLTCDVNCCCDMDCTDGILQAFVCDDGVEFDDYHHGEGLERCEIDNGLLCIVRDNLGPPDYYLKAATHVEYFTYRWPETSLNDLEARNEILRDFYKYGDVIMAYDTKAEKLDTIAILTTLSDDSNCHLMMPIKFLSTRTVKCAYNVNELCAYNNKLLQQLLHSQLFHRPSKMTETREAADSFSINIQLCKHSSCIQLADEKELSGDEVFDEMRMEFEVNDTSLTALTVSMMLSRDEVTCGTDDFGPMKIIHTADVRFKNAHEKREKTIRKHSRGYNDEELIVASRWRPLNESVTDGEMAFDYFRNDSQTDFHMKLPESRDGKCVLSDEFYDSVRFNENSHTTCAVELTWDAKTNETLCQQLQQQILHFIFNSMNLTDNYTQENFASDVFVSQFWSPGMSVGLWTRIQVLNVPAWSPDVREVEKTSICSNVATSITFSFFSSRVRATRSRKYENVIERVTAEFGQVEELKYSMDDENQTETVEIQVRVQFFNVHETSYANNFVGALPLISSLSFISFLKNIL